MSLKRCCCIGFLCLACVLPGMAGTARDGQVLLVIPARYTVVQFAFDIARMRSVYLAAYSTEGKTGTPVLHVWDSEAREWVRTSLEEYRSGTIFLTKPKSVVVVGSTGQLPAGLGQASPWGGKVSQVSSLGIADMVNALHAELAFTASEWRWLAKRYNLELEDRNTERRRYGRYGPPGSKREPPTQERMEDDVVMPGTVAPVAAPRLWSEAPDPRPVRQPVRLEEKGLPLPTPEDLAAPLEEKGGPAPFIEEKGAPAPQQVDIAPEDK